MKLRFMAIICGALAPIGFMCEALLLGWLLCLVWSGLVWSGLVWSPIVSSLRSSYCLSYMYSSRCSSYMYCIRLVVLKHSMYCSHYRARIVTVLRAKALRLISLHSIRCSFHRAKALCHYIARISVPVCTIVTTFLVVSALVLKHSY
jgi:hypothetical protein